MFGSAGSPVIAGGAGFSETAADEMALVPPLTTKILEREHKPCQTWQRCQIYKKFLT